MHTREQTEYTEKDAYSAFLDRHELRDTDLLRRDILPIYWTAFAKILIQQGYTNLSEEIVTTDPTVGLLFSMLDRVFEHVEGAIVAFNTGSPASAEAISRTAVESAVTILYILAVDELDQRMSRLEAYFEDYFDTVDKQVKNWREVITRMSGKEAEAHSRGAQRRENANKQLRQFIESQIATWKATRNISSKIKWPNKKYSQFCEIGEETFYRTVYARMSSQTHGDAEDILRYLLGITTEDQMLLNKGAIETVNFSRLLVYFGVQFYLKACQRYSQVFQFDIIDILRMGLKIIDYQLSIISLEGGAF